MRIITKFMLACSVVGSLSLTSCKDYSEEDVIDVRVDMQNQLKTMQQQISDLTAKIDAAKCGCDGVSIIRNADGTYTIKDKNGNQVTVPENALKNPESDANGDYIIGSNGNKIYFPKVEEENGKKYIVIGNEKIEIPAPATPVEVPAITIDGDKITIVNGGNTWEFDKSTVGAACDCTVAYDAANNKYTITAGGQSVDIVPGTVCSYVDNGDNVTFNIGTQSALTLKKVTSDVWAEKDAEGNDVICIQKYNSDGTKNGEVTKITVAQPVTPTPPTPAPEVDLSGIRDSIKTILVELYGEEGTAAAPKAGSVADRLNKLEDVTEIIYGAGGTAANPTESSIVGRLNSIDDKISKLTARVGKLEDARAKQVTGIVVQKVVNPAFGSYNSILTNVQTNMLMAYYGVASNYVSFPSNDDESIEKVKLRGNSLIMKGAGNAGYMYVTINPNTVDFTGMDNCLSLVNSQDAKSPVTLGAVQKTDDVLTFGYTRAAQNGFYLVPATIEPSAVGEAASQIHVDKSAIKNALRDLINVRDKAGAKVALKEIAEVGIKTAAGFNDIEADGVKCSWTDQYGEHAVYSNYNIAALAASPLGFNSVDGIFADGGKYWKAYDKAKTLVTKGAKKVGKKLSDQITKQFMLDKLQGDIADIQAKFNHIDEIQRRDGQFIMRAQVEVGPFNDVEVGPFNNVPVVIPDQIVGTGSYTTEVEIDVPDTYDPVTDTWNTKKQKVSVTIPSKDITVPGRTVYVNIPAQKVTIRKQTVDIEVDVTDQINEMVNEMIDQVNQGFKDVNDLIDALNEALVDVNLVLDNIHNLQNKLESGSYLPTVYAYLDRIANKVAKVTPELFKPVLLVNSDNGLGLCGYAGAPSQVTGEVTIVPTTMTAELLTPIYKKYIRVNGGNGQYVDGYSLDITSQLQPGANTIEYRALDYQGNEWVGIYQINR